MKTLKSCSALPGDQLRIAGVCLLLALAVWAVFGQTLQHGFVNYDDDVYVYENPVVTRGFSPGGVEWAFTHTHASNWHPLTTLTHMVDCELYGLNPAGHHLTNVILHTAVTLLLFLLLRGMTGAFWPSALVAAVFAIHPLRVESVAWVAERKDVLSGLFFMMTLLAYVSYTRRQEATDQGRFAFLWSPAYWLALVLFACGLMSKPMLVTLPFLMFLLDYWPLQRFANHDSRRVIARLLWEKLPFVLLSVIACLVTILAQEKAADSLRELTLRWRAGNALVAYVAYIQQMCFPEGLAVLYPHPGKNLPLWKIAFSALCLLTITAGVFASRRNRPYLLVGWLWYLGMLVPVIGMVQVGIQERADRYTYLPQIGLCVLLVWAAADVLSTSRYRRVMLGGAATAMLVGLMTGAFLQTRHWRDSVSLWTQTLACTSGNYLAHNSLGCALALEGRMGEAILHFNQAIELKPDYARAHDNLGNALATQGKLAEAIQHYERALQLEPDLVEAHKNIGNSLDDVERSSEAIRHYERALMLNPCYPEAHHDLGIALSRQDQPARAIQHLQKALSLAVLQQKPALAKVINEQMLAYRSALSRSQTPQ